MIRTRIGTCLLLAGLATAQTAAADIDFAALAQRLPTALPGNATAAAQGQSAGLAAIEALNKDLGTATEQLSRDQANRIYAGTALAPGNSDATAQQARMQAMAQQMQGMSQQQQIAMAMQMQQQVQSNMGMQAAAIPDPAEQQALTALMQDPQRGNQRMQSGLQLAQRAVALRQSADAQHQQI